MYDIRPGNGAGLFLQQRSPHGAFLRRGTVNMCAVSQVLYLCNQWSTDMLTVVTAGTRIHANLQSYLHKAPVRSPLPEYHHWDVFTAVWHVATITIKQPRSTHALQNSAKATHYTKFLQYTQSHKHKNSFKFLYLHHDPDQHQNLIICCQSHIKSLQNISLKFVYKFFSYFADRKTKPRQRLIFQKCP